MKIKVELLVTAIAILTTVDMTKMKLSTSYKVRQVMKESEAAIQDFEAKRVAIAEEHGKLNEEGTQYDFATDDSKDAFQKALNEMLDDEVDIPITPIDISLLDEYIDIEPQNIPFVEWFITGLEA